MIQKFQHSVCYSARSPSRLKHEPVLSSSQTWTLPSMPDLKVAYLFLGNTINIPTSLRILQVCHLRLVLYCQTHPRKGTFNTIGGGLHIADWQGSGNVWEAYRRVCPPNSLARRLISSKRITANDSAAYFELGNAALGNEFKFVHDVDRNYSFCNNPWAHYYQGHFFSDWRTVPVPLPILSPAKSSGYGDIKIPSHYYYGTTRRYSYGYDDVNHYLKEVDSMETPWEKKSEKIFWRGATTGGGSSPPGFSPQYQRHRQDFSLILKNIALLIKIIQIGTAY